MPKKSIQPNYADDNIFRASKQVASISLKNIQPPPIIMQPDINAPNQPTGNPINPVLQTSALQTTTGSKSEYSDFIKGLKALNNNLDGLLTGLDNMFQYVPYPRIDLRNKRRHNPRFEPHYDGVNRGNVGRGLAGGVIDPNRIQEEGYLNSCSLRELQEYCINNHLELDGHRGRKITYINAILNPPNNTNNNNEPSNIEPDVSQIDNDIDYSALFPDEQENENELNYSQLDEAYPEFPNIYEQNENFNEVPPDQMSDVSTNVPDVTMDDSEDDDHDDDNDNDFQGQDDMQELITNDLYSISNQISNLQVQFSSYISPTFNMLQQGKVDDIKKEIDTIKPKVEELVRDEFVNVYHVPQCNSIKDNFDKLYSNVIIRVNSWVKPRINGGDLKAITHQTHLIHNYPYYL